LFGERIECSSNQMSSRPRLFINTDETVGAPASNSNSVHTPLLSKANPRRREPLLPSQRQLKVSDAVFNLTVSAVGAGILVIPYSFKCTGMVLGVLLLAVVAFCSLKSLDLLEAASRRSRCV
jgi:proton-coupled amino acid transporter